MRYICNAAGPAAGFEMKPVP